MDDHMPLPGWQPGAYNSLEVTQCIHAIFDHAIGSGHMLGDQEPHPVRAGVRVYRCGGCTAMYKLFMPGVWAGPWNEPDYSIVPGICPASFQGTVELAWGIEGGLYFWGQVEEDDSLSALITQHLEDCGHTSIRHLARTQHAVRSKSVLAQTMPDLWHCGCCQRLVGKLNRPASGVSELWLTHIMCSGKQLSIRGKR